MTRWHKGPVRSPAPTKYHNVKTRGYDSAHEAERARELHLMEKAGKIRDLREQVRFELIPNQYEMGTKIVTRNGKPDKVQTVRKLVERKVEYVADFVYVDAATEETVVEDAKGVRTPDYIIKRKLMLWLYGIRVREV